MLDNIPNQIITVPEINGFERNKHAHTHTHTHSHSLSSAEKVHTIRNMLLEEKLIYKSVNMIQQR